MAKIRLEFTTEELYKLTFAVECYSKMLPDQTVKERSMLVGLLKRLNDAYMKADWIDFKETHP